MLCGFFSDDFGITHYCLFFFGWVRKLHFLTVPRWESRARCRHRRIWQYVLRRYKVVPVTFGQLHIALLQGDALTLCSTEPPGVVALQRTRARPCFLDHRHPVVLHRFGKYLCLRSSQLSRRVKYSHTPSSLCMQTVTYAI